MKLQEAGLTIHEIKAILDAPVLQQKALLEEAAIRLYQERDTLNAQIRNMEEYLESLEEKQPADQ